LAEHTVEVFMQAELEAILRDQTRKPSSNKTYFVLVSFGPRNGLLMAEIFSVILSPSEKKIMA
jgi:hypothetical protein